MKIRRKQNQMEDIEKEVENIKEERSMNTYLLEFGSREETVGSIVIIAENVFGALSKFIEKYKTEDVQLDNLCIDISIPEVIQ